MRVLVTGATGFVGSRLVQRLCQSGHLVRALVRSRSKVNRRRLLVEHGAAVVEGDVTDEASLRRALDDMDAAVHCAGHVQDWGLREPFYQSNVVGTACLVKVAQGRIGRLVHISTTDVYGYPHQRQVAEDHPLRPCNYYNETKLLGEQLVMAQEDMQVTVLRPASIYGPGSYSIVVEFLEQVKSGFFPFFRSRDVIAGLTYVDNLCDAIMLALERTCVLPRVYNITDGSAVTWEEFVDGLAELSGSAPKKIVLPYRLGYSAGVFMESTNRVLRSKRRPLLSRMAVQLLGNHQDYSIQRARAELKYQPRSDFAEGMKHTGKWLQDSGLV